MELVERSELKLLADIGLLAVGRGDFAAAETIFGAIELARPGSPAGYVGRAFALLCAGRGDDALAVLDRAQTEVPVTEQAEVHAIRGLSLQLAGRSSESRKALQRAGDQPLARKLLGEPVT